MEDKKRFVIKEMRHHVLCGEWSYDTEEEAINRLSYLIEGYDDGACYIHVIENGVDISNLDWTRCSELYNKAREIVDERYMKSFEHEAPLLIRHLEIMTATYSGEELTASTFLKYVDDFESLYKKVKALKDSTLHLPESERDDWLKWKIKNGGLL